MSKYTAKQLYIWAICLIINKSILTFEECAVMQAFVQMVSLHSVRCGRIHCACPLSQHTGCIHAFFSHAQFFGKIRPTLYLSAKSSINLPRELACLHWNSIHLLWHRETYLHVNTHPECYDISDGFTLQSKSLEGILNKSTSKGSELPYENRSVMNNVYDFQSSEDFRLESKNKLILTYVGQKHSPIRPLLVLAFHAENIILTAQGKAIVLLDRRAIERENWGEK